MSRFIREMDFFTVPAVTLAMGQMSLSKRDSTDLCHIELNYSNLTTDFIERKCSWLYTIFSLASVHLLTPVYTSFSFWTIYVLHRRRIVPWNSTDISESHCLWDRLAVIDMSILRKGWNYSTFKFYFHCLNTFCRRISWNGNKQYHGQGFYILQLHLFMPLTVAGFLSTFTLKGCSTVGLILLTGYLARSSLSDQIIAQQHNRSSVK